MVVYFPLSLPSSPFCCFFWFGLVFFLASCEEGDRDSGCSCEIVFAGKSVQRADKCYVFT